MAHNLPQIDYEAFDPAIGFEGVEAVLEKCPRESLVFVGKPSPEDIEDTLDDSLPERITADFRTTVDDTEWRG